MVKRQSRQIDASAMLVFIRREQMAGSVSEKVSVRERYGLGKT